MQVGYLTHLSQLQNSRDQQNRPFKPFCLLVAEPYFAQSCARPQGKGPTAQANWLKIIDFSGAGSFAIASKAQELHGSILENCRPLPVLHEQSLRCIPSLRVRKTEWSHHSTTYLRLLSFTPIGRREEAVIVLSRNRKGTLRKTHQGSCPYKRS